MSTSFSARVVFVKLAKSFTCDRLKSVAQLPARRWLTTELSPHCACTKAKFPWLQGIHCVVSCQCLVNNMTSVT